MGFLKSSLEGVVAGMFQSFDPISYSFNFLEMALGGVSLYDATPTLGGWGTKRAFRRQLQDDLTASDYVGRLVGRRIGSVAGLAGTVAVASLLFSNPLTGVLGLYAFWGAVGTASKAYRVFTHKEKGTFSGGFRYGWARITDPLSMLGQNVMYSATGAGPGDYAWKANSWQQIQDGNVGSSLRSMAGACAGTLAGLAGYAGVFVSSALAGAYFGPVGAVIVAVPLLYPLKNALHALKETTGFDTTSSWHRSIPGSSSSSHRSLPIQTFLNPRKLY